MYQSILVSAAAESCAAKSRLVALASATAFLLATTLIQFLAKFCYYWQICPIQKPGTINLLPSSVSWPGKNWMTY